jgi:hypothetical protein
VTVGGTDRMGVVDLATGALDEFGRGLAPRLAGGQLVYATVDGTLRRQPFDAGRRRPTGSSEEVTKGVAVTAGARRSTCRQAGRSSTAPRRRRAIGPGATICA